MASSKLVIIFIVFLTVTVDGNETRNGTITSYNPSELLLKIFNPNTTQAQQRGNRLKFEDYPSGPTAEEQHQYYIINYDGEKPLKFEDSLQEHQNVEGNRPLRFQDDIVAQELEQNEDSQYGLVFEENTPLKFEDGHPNFDQHEDRPFNFEPETLDKDKPLKFQNTNHDVKGVNYPNNNSIEGHNKKKRKRRRKPKRLPNQPGLGGPGHPGVPGGYQGYGAGYGYPGLQGVPFRRPRRRPRPSLASDALTAVTGALTSIAQYDDYQCVPRLLCEAAGGGALGTAGVLDAVAGIQPLLTLLSVYNGISSSPLFVFGRAVFLGMTSKGNTGTCRYAYPQCPSDPEQLIHYLNNHNGGFFRFFNAPPNQNLQQFYQHLGQNFNQNGQYPPDYYQNGQYPPNYQAGQDFNHYQNQQYPPNFNQPAQNYNQYQSGQYPPEYFNQGLYRPEQKIQGGYGLFPQSLYGNQNYGQNYDYNSYGKIRFRDSKKIEDRIQNKPVPDADDNYDDEIYADNQSNNFNSKFAFPDNFVTKENTNNAINNNKIRDNKALRFPEDQNSYENLQTTSNRKQKAFYFPNTNNYPNRYNNQNSVKYINYNEFNNNIKQKPNNHNNNYYHNHNAFNNNNINHSQNNNKKINQNQNTFNNNNIKQQPYNYNNKNYYHHNYNEFTNNNIKNKPNNNNNYYHNNNDFNNNDYYFDSKHGFYVKKDNSNNKLYNNESDGTKVVYVVRGNGDPNHPEIVKVKTGESVY